MKKNKIHPNDLSREALRELVGGMSWVALDLAQELCALRDLYGKDQIPDSVIRRAYMLSTMPYSDISDDCLKWKYNIAVFSADGLSVSMGDDLKDILGGK